MQFPSRGGRGRGRGPVLSGQTGNNQSRSPLWNTIIIFSCSIYLHLFEIPIYLWLRSIGDAIELHFAFRSKITWNYIFEAANCRRIMFVCFGHVPQRARSRTGNRGRCGTRPNNSCEGHKGKRGTDAFYFRSNFFFYTVEKTDHKKPVWGQIK